MRTITHWALLVILVSTTLHSVEHPSIAHQQLINDLATQETTELRRKAVLPITALTMSAIASAALSKPDLTPVDRAFFLGLRYRAYNEIGGLMQQSVVNDYVLNAPAGWSADELKLFAARVDWQVPIEHINTAIAITRD
ncbi:MAG: hypothetical protein PF961_01590 [Planctomycetota bacterium]|nr:hypothetical protein [Planctomycetota bacterium]